MHNDRYLVLLGILSMVAGCSFIFPRQFEYISLLVPKKDLGVGYSTKEDGTVIYAIEGLRLEVKYLTDRVLNEMFPQESTQGKYSTNPYTYGNYVDPTVGYVRNRFTVFQVTVYNLDFAKIELQPLRSLLLTDRKGEVLQAYGVLAGSAPKNFESYYRALKGSTGNEDYRFNIRMGLVRTHNYAVDQKIFKGESYSGFIVFDPLDPEVKEVRLLLRDFILKFNAYGKPLETMDIEFRFERQLTLKLREQEEILAVHEEISRARLKTASEVSGNVTGDITREVSAIDAFIKSRMDELNPCFQRDFAVGKASEGEVEVQFAILPNGMVEGVQVLNSTVVSEAVGVCIANQIRNWRFPPSTRGRAQSLGADSLAAAPPREELLESNAARVTVTAVLEFADIREE